MKKSSNYKKSQLVIRKYMFYKKSNIKKLKTFYQINLLSNQFFTKNYGLTSKYKKNYSVYRQVKKFNDFRYFIENKLDKILINLNFLPSFNLLTNFFKQGLVLINNKIINNKSYLFVSNDILTVKPLLLNFIKKLFLLKKKLFFMYKNIYSCYLRNNYKIKKIIFSSHFYNNLIINYNYAIIICVSNLYLQKAKYMLTFNEINNFYLD